MGCLKVLLQITEKQEYYTDDYSLGHKDATKVKEMDYCFKVHALS